MLARLAVSETSVLRASGGAVPDPALSSFSILNGSGLLQTECYPLSL